MSNNDDGKLTAIQVADLLTNWQKEININNTKVEVALRNLNDIRTEMIKATKELDQAKTIYQKSPFFFVKEASAKHLKFSITIFAIVVGFFSYLLLAKRDFSYKDQNRQIEAKTSKN